MSIFSMWKDKVTFTRYRLLAAFGILAPLIGGCAASDEGPTLGNVGRNFTRDWANARLYDRAELAQTKGDRRASKQVALALDARINNGDEDAISIVRSAITTRLQEAALSDAEAQSSTDTQSTLARGAANRAYRAALDFVPTDSKVQRQLDAQDLNALGYFLADRGANRADFERGEKLTALAIELSPTRNGAERLIRATGPQDSHAWALFKLGRTREALEEQEEVLEIARVGAEQYGPPSAEILYHMGAIYRVAGFESDARAAFRNALQLNTDPQLQNVLESALEGSVV